MIDPIVGGLPLPAYQSQASMDRVDLEAGISVLKEIEAIPTESLSEVGASKIDPEKFPKLAAALKEISKDGLAKLIALMEAVECSGEEATS